MTAREWCAIAFLVGNILLFVLLHIVFGLPPRMSIFTVEAGTMMIGVWPIASFIGGFTVSGSTTDLENTPENFGMRVVFLITALIVYVYGMSHILAEIP